MPLDLTDVALFARVCVTRNLTVAGREFALSPAASSARMAHLERQLGARLLHRTTRHIALTQDGEAFLERALHLLDAADLASNSVGHALAQPTGLLRVSASASFGRAHIMPAVADFLRQYPGIRLDLRLSDTVIDLAANAIDVAVRIGPLRDSTLVARVLAPNRLVVCASPQYLQDSGTPQHPQELVGHQCLVLEGWNPWNFQDKDGSPLRVRVSGRFRSDNGEALRDAAVDGLGIAGLSTWLVGDQLRDGSLVALLGDYPVNVDSMISAVYLNRSFLPQKSRAFIDFLGARFGPQPYWDVYIPGIGNTATTSM